MEFELKPPPDEVLKEVNIIRDADGKVIRTEVVRP